MYFHFILLFSSNLGKNDSFIASLWNKKLQESFADICETSKRKSICHMIHPLCIFDDHTTLNYVLTSLQNSSTLHKMS